MQQHAAINSRVAVDDLLHGAIIQSGNDSCMALAEGIAGSESAFTEKMTARARELGMTRSTFANSNGLPHPDNKMTVRELATLARHIILTYPDFYKLFGERGRDTLTDIDTYADIVDCGYHDYQSVSWDRHDTKRNC